jgi:ubiquinol-cytochrome c reductase cytochrome c subunit
VKRLLLALACASGVLALALSPGASSGQSSQIARGRTLFVESCASCHGIDARGVKGLGPSVRDVGARAADFYLSTGRMPIDGPQDQPIRKEPAFPRSDIDALVAYIASLGGPPIPRVDPSRGSLAEGFQLFTDSCAGCHQIVGQGGMVTGARVPALEHATPTEIAEAVRIGPYLMPKFGEARIDQRKLDSLARYIDSTHAPPDKGGWGIGHIGPIPEGFVAWLIGLAALLVVARVIGERTMR